MRPVRAQPVFAALVLVALGVQPRAAGPPAQPARAGTAPDSSLQLDRARSHIFFVADSRFGKVRGEFSRWRFTGRIGAGLTATGSVSIEVASLATGNGMRDRHLRGPDFLDVALFPRATFAIRTVVAAGPWLHRMEGTLSAHGSTIPLVLTLRRSQRGSAVKLQGVGRLSRAALGISYHSAINPIGDQVGIEVELLLVRSAPNGGE